MLTLVINDARNIKLDSPYGEQADEYDGVRFADFSKNIFNE